MHVVIAQPDARREAFAEEALAIAGYQVRVASCWEEVVALCLSDAAEVLVVDPRTPRAFPVTLMRFCSLPRRDRPGVVLWGAGGDRSLEGIIGEEDRLLSPVCTAGELIEAVTEAACSSDQEVLHSAEILAANQAGTCLVAGTSSRRRHEVVSHFRRRGLRALGVASADELVVRLYVDPIRLAVIDLGMADPEALELGRVARAWSHALPLVFWTAVLPESMRREVRALRGRVVVDSAGAPGLIDAAASVGVATEALYGDLILGPTAPSA